VLEIIRFFTPTPLGHNEKKFFSFFKKKAVTVATAAGVGEKDLVHS
jgi:hypothetical protein